jgi:hypothetical protein
MRMTLEVETENANLHFGYYAASFSGTVKLRCYECHTTHRAAADESAEYRRGPSKSAFDFLFRGSGAGVFWHAFFDGVFYRFARRFQQSVVLAESKGATAAARGLSDVSPVYLVLPGYGILVHGVRDIESFVGHFPANPEIPDFFVRGCRD